MNTLTREATTYTFQASSDETRLGLYKLFRESTKDRVSEYKLAIETLRAKKNMLIVKGENLTKTRTQTEEEFEQWLEAHIAESWGLIFKEGPELADDGQHLLTASKATKSISDDSKIKDRGLVELENLIEELPRDFSSEPIVAALLRGNIHKLKDFKGRRTPRDGELGLALLRATDNLEHSIRRLMSSGVAAGVQDLYAANNELYEEIKGLTSNAGPRQ